MTALLLFASTFFLVLALGLQSLFVNSGRRYLAMGNSFCIGLGNLALFKLAPTASGIEVAAFLIGGPFGILTAMLVFQRFFRRAG